MLNLPIYLLGSSYYLHTRINGQQVKRSLRTSYKRVAMGGVERGERNIALVNVARIVATLGMQPSEFFKALDEPTKGPPQKS